MPHAPTSDDNARGGAGIPDAPDVDAVARIIDPDAWHESLPTDGCGAYWISRRNDARRKAKAVRALMEGQS